MIEKIGGTADVGEEQRRPANNNHCLISGVIRGVAEAKAAKICCNRGGNGGKRSYPSTKTNEATRSHE